MTAVIASLDGARLADLLSQAAFRPAPDTRTRCVAATTRQAIGTASWPKVGVRGRIVPHPGL